ncbi:thiamine phosphate phosphatase [Ranunculus cassubicifolius]
MACLFTKGMPTGMDKIKYLPGTLNLTLQSREKTSSLSPILSPSNPPPILLHNQAIGMVASSQDNFMRVLIQNPNPNVPANPRDGVELLCVVKAVLKKIKRRVLVGDKVLVGAINWVDKRGMIENVFQRSCEISDPPVANVDQLLALFSMEQPKVEEFSLTRFLIEAESTGIPLTLALYKCELVDEEPFVHPKNTSNSSVTWSLASFQFLSSATFPSFQANFMREFSLIRNSSQIGFGLWAEIPRISPISDIYPTLPLSGGGYLADTPGFNQPSLMKVTKKSLAQIDCLHLGEPGCVVNGDWERYPYYLQLLDEIKIREEYKVGDMGVKQAEPRLELKKHRRQSRKRTNQSIIEELDDLEDDDDEIMTIADDETSLEAARVVNNDKH